VKNQQRWGVPGWPWELELLALVFVATSIIVPFWLQHTQTPDSSQLSLIAKAELVRNQQTTSWSDLSGAFWAIVIVGLYVAHIAMASSAVRFMSTPISHLWAPLVFAMIGYSRLYALTQRGSTLSHNIVSGSPLEILLWVVGVLAITFLVARIRMARLTLKFKTVDWDVSTPSLYDSSFGELVFQWRPLLYPPRMIRACEQGILIEGFFYEMPIPFDSIQAMDAVHGAGFTSSGYCLATSMKSLVRVQTTEQAEPILISPRDRNTFLHYCQQHIALRTPLTRSGETEPVARPTAPEQAPQSKP
jgi:hypothetical protein